MLQKFKRMSRLYYISNIIIVKDASFGIIWLATTFYKLRRGRSRKMKLICPTFSERSEHPASA